VRLNAVPLDGFIFLPPETASDIIVCLLRAGYCCNYRLSGIRQTAVFYPSLDGL
jgi:hypothetical protein